VATGILALAAISPLVCLPLSAVAAEQAERCDETQAPRSLTVQKDTAARFVPSSTAYAKKQYCYA
jgi:hypothetical protein